MLIFDLPDAEAIGRAAAIGNPVALDMLDGIRVAEVGTSWAAWGEMDHRRANMLHVWAGTLNGLFHVGWDAMRAHLVAAHDGGAF